MGSSALLVTLIIGALAGWLAGQLIKGHGLGIVGNIIVGVIGAFVGNWLFGVLGLHIASGHVGAFLRALSGAMVLLFVLGLIKR